MTVDHSRWMRPGWFLAVCEVCTPVLPQPFRDPTGRDRWADVHAVTGHFVARIDPTEETR